MPTCDALIVENSNIPPAKATPLASPGARKTAVLSHGANSTQRVAIPRPTASAVAEQSPMILPALTGSAFRCPPT